MMSCRTCKNWIGPNVTYVNGHGLCYRKCRLIAPEEVKENELCNAWELSLSHEMVLIKDKKWIALCNQAGEDEDEGRMR